MKREDDSKPRIVATDRYLTFLDDNG